MKKYFYIKNGQQLGPFTYDELWNQNIQANTMVWHEGMSEWKPASAFTEFGNWFAPTPNPKKQRVGQLKGQHRPQAQQRRQVQQRSQHPNRPQPVKKKRSYRAIIGISIFLIGCVIIYSYWLNSGGQTPLGSQNEVTREQGKSHSTKKNLQAQLPDQADNINLNKADYPSSNSGLGGSKDEKFKEAIIPEFALVTTAEDLYFGTPQDSDEMRTNLQNLLVFKAKDEEMADEFVPILEEIHTNTDFVANDEVYIITSGDADENLGGLVYITKKLSTKQLEEATEFNVGAVYITVEGPVFEPGYFNEEDGTVTVATHHFSPWKWLVNKVYGTPETSIQQVIQQEAYKSAEALGSKVEEKLIEGIESSIEKLNLDNTAKAKILSAVMKNREEIGNIAAAQEDPAKASQSVALMFGKIIVDNIDEDDLGKLKFGNSLKTLTEKSELVENAATELGSGNYWKIVELVAKDYTDNNIITKVVTTAATGINLTIKVWEDKKVNQIYKEWSKAPDKNEYWKDVAYKGGYDVYFRQVRLKGLKGCNDYDDGSAERCLEKLFQNRVKKQEATAYEAKKIKALYDIYSREGMTSIRYDFYVQQKSETGQKIISKNDQFRFFLKKMNEIQRDLQSIGKGGDGTWNRIKISDEAQKLMYAYSEGGKESYNKQMNEVKAKMNKNLDVGTTLESNSKTPKSKEEEAKREFKMGSIISESGLASYIVTYATTNIIEEETEYSGGMYILRQEDDYLGGNRTFEVLNIDNQGPEFSQTRILKDKSEGKDEHFMMITTIKGVLSKDKKMLKSLIIDSKLENKYIVTHSAPDYRHNKENYFVQLQNIPVTYSYLNDQNGELRFEFKVSGKAIEKSVVKYDYFEEEAYFRDGKTKVIEKFTKFKKFDWKNLEEDDYLGILIN